MFEVGDIVRGKGGSPYRIMDKSMTKGAVKSVSGNEMMVRILEHKFGSMGSYTVDQKYFEKIGHLEVFDFAKFLELMKESEEKAAEYLREADLSGTDLREADLSGADLRGADLRGADLREADLRGADLRGADLREADLRGADLRGANLREADLRGADLREADLREADLREADLRGADLREADLSGTEGLLDAINYLEANFERTAEGYIVYKTFGVYNNPPETWKIEEGAILEETCNTNRTDECGCGINVATLEWVKNDNNGVGKIYKLLIKSEWLPGVVVPYETNGKIRCSRAQIIGTLD